MLSSGKHSGFFPPNRYHSYPKFPCKFSINPVSRIGSFSFQRFYPFHKNSHLQAYFISVYTPAVQTLLSPI